MYGYKGPLTLESYLRLKKKIVIPNQEATSLYYFTFNVRERSFSYRISENSPEIKNVHRGRDLIGFDDVLSPQEMQLCKWKYGFKILTTLRDYILFAEKVEIYKKWMRMLNFVFNKIDILHPTSVINFDFDNKENEHLEDENKDIKKLEEKYEIIYRNQENTNYQNDEKEKSIHNNEMNNKTVPTFSHTPPYIKKRVSDEVKKETTFSKNNCDQFDSNPPRFNPLNSSFGPQILEETRRDIPTKNYTSQEVIDSVTSSEINDTDPLNFTVSDKGINLNHLSIYKNGDLPKQKPNVNVVVFSKPKIKDNRTLFIEHNQVDIQPEERKEIIKETLPPYTIFSKPFDMHELHIKDQGKNEFIVNLEGLHCGPKLNEKQIFNIDEERFFNNKIVTNKVKPQNENEKANDESITNNKFTSKPNKKIDRLLLLQEKIIREVDEDCVYLGKAQINRKQNITEHINENDGKAMKLPVPNGNVHIITQGSEIRDQTPHDNWHMHVEATYKTSESTFIRDDYHLAAHELNGDKMLVMNEYAKMMAGNERGIGKEIVFEKENNNINDEGISELEKDWNEELKDNQKLENIENIN